LVFFCCCYLIIEVLAEVIKLCVVGAKVMDICIAGDKLINDATKTVYIKSKVSKGKWITQ
jgi:methionine aminopeptidase